MRQPDDGIAELRFVPPADAPPGSRYLISVTDAKTRVTAFTEVQIAMMRALAAASSSSASWPASRRRRSRSCTLQKTSGGGAYTGGTLDFQLAVTRIGTETALVIHDPLPAEPDALARLGRRGDARLHDDAVGRARLPTIRWSRCNVGGELQAQVSDLGVEPGDAGPHLSRAAVGGDGHQHGERDLLGRLHAGADVERRRRPCVAPTVTIAKSGPATARRGAACAGRSPSPTAGPYPLD